MAIAYYIQYQFTYLELKTYLQLKSIQNTATTHESTVFVHKH